MASYLIAAVAVHDPEGYEQYRAAVPALVRKHGGEYLVRGGALEVVEGEWSPRRLAVLRFPDRNAALAFLNDPEYLPLKEIRHRVAHTDLLLVEGV